MNQEILSLKSQIEKLTEKCNRLEQENQIFRKHALPETLALIENRSSVHKFFILKLCIKIIFFVFLKGVITNQSSSNSINVQSNGVNLTSSTQISVNDSHNLLAHSTYISEPNDSAKTNNSLLLTTAVDKIQDCMTNSMTEHILNNNIDPITTHSSNLYEYDSLNNHNIHNSDESIMNSNETKS